MLSPYINVEITNLFLRRFSQEIPAGVHAVMIWDQAGFHTGKYLIVPENITVVRLPPYAPELNPDEGVWANAKARLANGRPDDLPALYQRLYSALRGLRQSQPRLRRCFHQSELPRPLF